jgi:DNA-binding NtrC family response regulator
MKRKKILVIDDEEDFKILMRNFFVSSGCQVFMAGSIKEGLRILDQEHPDVMFLDNNLPDGFGWENIEFIRENYPETQLNLISAYNVPKTSSSSFRILEKPLLMDELNKFIEN